MPNEREELDRAVRSAVRHFWQTRDRQAKRQGGGSGAKDRGARRAVTGGAHLDAFADLLQRLMIEAGAQESAVHRGNRVELPGFFRPEKKWDLVVVTGGKILATIEFKAHVGPSFGNNFNNRTEEALGSALDYWTAFREGAFSPSPKPWLGYLMLLEDSPNSQRAVSASEPHFPVLEEFRSASYAKRYELLLTKMIRERHYDGACLMLSSRSAAQTGEYSEPSPELAFANFAGSLLAHVHAHTRFQG